MRRMGITSEKKRASSPISRVLSWTVIHLGPASPQASSNLPESSAGHAIGFLFGLAPGGVYHRRGLLPATRCALTAPFHPYLITEVTGRFAFCCTCRGLAPPRSYLAPCSMEPGLSSTRFLKYRQIDKRRASDSNCPADSRAD